MCLKQRHPYYAIIVLFILIYYFKKTQNIWPHIVSQLAIIYGLFYSIWHVGIEQKILTGPTSCSSDLLKIDSIQSLKEQIINQAINSCSDITWIIYGLSAATINTFLLLFILLFNSIYLIESIYGSKKI